MEAKTTLTLSEWFDKKAIKTQYTQPLKPLVVGFLSLYGKGWDSKAQLSFVNYCVSLNLNPFNNDIYMVKYGNTYQPLINFKKFLEIAQDDPNYNGVSYERHFVNADGLPLPLNDRYIIVRAHYKNGSVPYEKCFFMNEFNNGQGQWKQRPNYMLEKTATKLTLEQAFRRPQHLQNLNLYTPEEMCGINSETLEVEDVTDDQIKQIEPIVIEEAKEEQEPQTVTLNYTELIGAK